MTKRTLQEWYNNNDITYSEKESLNKIGVSNYCDHHYLQDLEQTNRPTSSNKSNKFPLYIGLAVVVGILVAGIILYFLTRKKDDHGK